MGRHGNRIADSGTGDRADSRAERGYGTTGGVALPLLAAALVCLLATSGVWLFANTGGDDQRDETPIGLNVPTAGVNVPPNKASEGMTGAAAPGTKSPSGTASASGTRTTSASPANSGSKSPVPAGTSASAQAPQPSGAPSGPGSSPGTGPAPTSAPASPPATTEPPAASPPPRISDTAEAKKYLFFSRKITITVSYPPGAAAEQWRVEVPSAGRCDDNDSDVAKCQGGDEAHSTGGAPDDGKVQITFTVYDSVDEISYWFNGKKRTVDVQ